METLPLPSGPISDDSLERFEHFRISTANTLSWYLFGLTKVCVITPADPEDAPLHSALRVAVVVSPEHELMGRILEERWERPEGYNHTDHTWYPANLNQDPRAPFGIQNLAGVHVSYELHRHFGTFEQHVSFAWRLADSNSRAYSFEKLQHTAIGQMPLVHGRLELARLEMQCRGKRLATITKVEPTTGLDAVTEIPLSP